MSTLILPGTYFQKYDMRDDELFYRMPRKVVHIDEFAIAGLMTYFSRLLPARGQYLDLMSSWRSHLPPHPKPRRVIGLGLNAEEMADNPQLDDAVVQNLNRNPYLPFASAEFDAVTCTVSVQYLQHPYDVFREVSRVLKPGGVFVVSFSNRCFPTKAVMVWLNATDEERMSLVEHYFREGGRWDRIQADCMLSNSHDPLYILWAYKTIS